ncbi:MAG: hypothetical protein KUG82_17805 [Pseudomonadales bacterium]|nr:hypothetical protein [Pseudomonadales bacterium]
MDIQKLFGLPLDQENFDIDKHADLIGIKGLIAGSRSVKKMLDENGKNHPITQIAKRQSILKHLKNDLETEISPYDPLYYKKEVNTAEASDRKYAAEEKLLEYCLVVACGKLLKKINQEDFKPDVQALRDTPAKERHKRYWAILNDHTREAITNYQTEMKKKAAAEESDKDSEPGTNKDKKKEAGFWSKLFN